MSEMKKDKISNPQSVYNHPSKILDDSTLSREDKLKALDNLEYDCNQLMVASEERLSGGERPVSISDIHDAREKLSGSRVSPQSTGNSKTSL